MQAGKLDRRITLRKLVESQAAGSGAVVVTPVIVATVWAEKVEGPGASRFVGNQEVEWAPVVWETRYVLDGVDEPTAKWEILEGSRVYELLGRPQEIQRRKGWRFVTRSRAEDQE